jgi:5-dehydro-4-deoxyglucarate dehydratase
VAVAPDELASRLRGPVAFAITPFHGDAPRSIDWDAFRGQVDMLVASGLGSLVVAGTTGEFSSLASAEVVALARAAVDVVAGRVPVLAGAGLGMGSGQRLARALARAEIDGLLLMPPAYGQADADGLAGYYRALAAAAPGLGLVLYCRDQVPLDLALLQELAAVRSLVAVKEGHRRPDDLARARSQLGDRFRWLGGSGDDLVGAYAAAGADGFTSSIACFDPGVALRAWDLARDGSGELDALLARHVMPWFELRRVRRGYDVAVTKAAVEAFGGRAGPVRPPLPSLTAEHLEAVRALARRTGRLSR